MESDASPVNSVDYLFEVAQQSNQFLLAFNDSE
jgi:hypothetical protein